MLIITKTKHSTVTCSLLRQFLHCHSVLRWPPSWINLCSYLITITLYIMAMELISTEDVLVKMTYADDHCYGSRKHTRKQECWRNWTGCPRGHGCVDEPEKTQVMRVGCQRGTGHWVGWIRNQVCWRLCVPWNNGCWRPVTWTQASPANARRKAEEIMLGSKTSKKSLKESDDSVCYIDISALSVDDGTVRPTREAADLREQVSSGKLRNNLVRGLREERWTTKWSLAKREH